MRIVRIALFAVLLHDATARVSPNELWEEDLAMNEERELQFWQSYFHQESSLPPVPAPTKAPTKAPTPRPVFTPSPTPPPPTPPPIMTPPPTPPPVMTPPPTMQTPPPTFPPVQTPPPTLPPVQTPPPTLPPVPDPTPPPTLPPVPDPTPEPTPFPTLPPVSDPTPEPTPPPTQPPVPDPTPEPTPPPTQPPVPDPTPEPTPAPTLPPVLDPTPAPVADPTPAPTTLAPTPEMGPSVRDRLQPFALEGGAEWEDPESCQSKALARTEEQIGVESFTDAKLTQYYALYCIYNCTNMVPNIITATDEEVLEFGLPSWLLNRGWTANNLDPCADGWFGITCENDQVTAVELFQNQLTGNWPAEVTLLASDGPRATGAGNLFLIDLFDNRLLFNNFDNSWMTDLGSNMEQLFFGTTGFAGDFVPLPSNLEQLDASFTFISGGFVDSTFAGLDNLVFAEVSGNAYNQSVPNVLGSLPNLEELFISESFVTGDLSYMQGGMPSILFHFIDFNPELRGQLPTIIGSFDTLQLLSVSFNDIDGNLPAQIGNLPFVEGLFFIGNRLSGQIPPEYSQPPGLTALRLEGNEFTGIMPDQICALVGPFLRLTQLGADCEDPNFSCDCCHCCTIVDCFVMFDL